MRSDRSYKAIPILASFLITLSLFVNANIYNVRIIEQSFYESIRQSIVNALPVATTFSFFCFIGILYIVLKFNIFSRVNINIAILSLLLSLFHILGISIQTSGNLQWLTSGWAHISLICIVFLGRELLYYTAVQLLYNYLQNNAIAKDKQEPHIIRVIFDTHPAIVIIPIIALCWSFYFIAYYPGIIGYDSQYQLNTYFGHFALNGHHPIVSTYITGILFSIGQLIGNDNFAAFFCVALQSIVLLIAIGCLFRLFSVYRVRYVFRFLVLLYFSLFTVWPAYACTLDKDTLFCAVSLLFYIELADLLLRNNAGRQKFTAFPLFGLLTSLLRNNGIIIIATLCIVAFLWRKKFKSTLLIKISAVILCVYMSISFLFFMILDIPKGGIQEMLSIPFQQTAYYLQKYGDKLTDDEYAKLDKVFVLDGMAESYDPNVSDPVKSRYKYGAYPASEDSEHSAALRDYFAVWLHQFFKDPLTYLEAAVKHTYKYYYTDIEGANPGYYILVKNDYINPDYYDFYWQPGNQASMRTKLEGLWMIASRIPFVGLLYNPGIYTSILLLFFFYFLSNQNRKGLIFVITVLVNILVCIASPVNGNIRYMLPVMAATPLIALFATTKTTEVKTV